MLPTIRLILAVVLVSTVTASLLPARSLQLERSFHLAPTSRSEECPVRLQEDPPLTSETRTVTSAHEKSSTTVQPRIVNGDEASPSLAPYVVSIFKDGEASCTGTLVSARWVISAAHCMINASHEVLIGARRTSDGPAQGAQLVGIKKVVVPNEYEGERGGRFDITTIELDEDAPEGAKFMKVSVNIEVPQAQSYVRVLGYGKIAEGVEDPADEVGKLRQVDVPVTSNDTCIDVYNVVDPRVQVCAGYVGRGGCDSCQGDSGGPMIQYDEAGEPVLVGIVSSGTGCARKGHPGIYMRVSAFTTWLESQAGLSFQKADSVKAVFEKNSNKGKIIGIVVGVCSAALVVAGAVLARIVIWWQRRRGISFGRSCKAKEREQRVTSSESDGCLERGHGEGVESVEMSRGDEEAVAQSIRGGDREVNLGGAEGGIGGM